MKLSLFFHALSLCEAWAFFLPHSPTHSMSLSASLRILIQGTKNAYTTAQTHDVLLYKLAKPTSEGQDQGLGVLTAESQLWPLCQVEEDGAEFVKDVNQQPMSAEKLNREGRLLRILSADRLGGIYTIDEYLDQAKVWLPVQQPTDKRQIIAPEEDGNDVSAVVQELIQKTLSQRKKLESILEQLQRSYGEIAAGKVVNPTPIGPYSQSIIAPPFFFLSGCIALNPQTGALVGSDDVRQQMQQAMMNMVNVLAANNLSLHQVVKVTIFVVDLDEHWSTINEVYEQVLQQWGVNVYPARSTVGVARLPKAALVEVEAIALL